MLRNHFGLQFLYIHFQNIFLIIILLDFVVFIQYLYFFSVINLIL